MQTFVDKIVEEIGFRPSFRSLALVQSALRALFPTAIVEPGAEAQLKQILSTLEGVLRIFNTDSTRLPIIAFTEFDRIINIAKKEKDGERILVLLGVWAQRLTERKIAHVIFVTDDPYTAIDMEPYFPLLHVVTASDVSESLSKEYLTRSLKISSESLPKYVDMVYDVVGGRIKDMEYIVANVDHGRSPDDICTELLTMTTEKVRRACFGENIFGAGEKWSNSDIWKVMNLLAEDDEVPYDKILFSALDGNEKKLRSMVNANIISIHINEENRKMIVPFSKLFKNAFVHLTQDDKEFTKKMNINFQLGLIAEKSAEIKSTEETLIKLSVATGPAVERKIQILNESLDTKLDQYEALNAQLKDLMNN
eukprot:TRINITY_DN939_c0_g1_i2.p1 TRINITY_DN939_c0_g1~~TRINITY_DN939_c0_g1_i2.p1  ORF type:complete len:366 (+),score=71.43 TRINITY_DN939_c0_g1_i2:1020-2117(+)